MISKSFIYRSNGTTPYIYTALWVTPSSDPLFFEIVFGNSTVTRTIEMTGEVNMEIRSESVLVREIASDSEIATVLHEESEISKRVSSDSVITTTLTAESAVDD